MNTEDLDDTHLCIKCNLTIVGLSKYIEHRKQSCQRNVPKQIEPSTSGAATANSSSSSIISRANLDHSYDSFNFAEPEAPSSYLSKNTPSHGGKTDKSVSEAYDLTYELGADVFFSSLQLQSVQSGGKTGSSSSSVSQRRPKEQPEEESWHVSNVPGHAQSCTDTLMKAVREIGESKKHDEVVFKPLKFVHDSPEASEDEEDDEEAEDFEAEDEDDEDYDPLRVAHATGTKWRHSPPAVPVEHTGGKWKPEHRPQLRVTHMERISPNWDEHADEPDTPEPETAAQSAPEHPPEDHTKGKWVPGKMLQRLEYRDNLDLTKLSQPSSSYWCNICCRKLKTRSNYEQHLRTGYHERRADAERQLEQAKLGGSLPLSKSFEPAPPAATVQPQQQRRRRRVQLLRCELCRHSMARHLMGKHLISHYHYRRLQQQTQQRRQSALQAILEHMPSIVRQSPFQCLPCRFFANTEQSFLSHWQSAEHLQLTSQLGGRFCCSYCQFECALNEQMWQHLLSAEHKEVLLALNRSVPICIGQRRLLQCSLCEQSFVYNVELRRHYASLHAGQPATGSASDAYQRRYRCKLCGAPQRSRVALQRHEKHKHRLAKYFCAICRLEFDTALQARRHRNQLQHKRQAHRSDEQHDLEHMLRVVLEDQQTSAPTTTAKAVATPVKQKSVLPLRCSSCRQCFDNAELLLQHRVEAHALVNHACLSCGCSFQSAQALGRHTRSCQPQASTSAAAASSAAAQQHDWRCSQCSFMAKYEADLLYHSLCHTRGIIGKQELLQCPRCPKQMRKYSLRAHLRHHTNERIFECDKCQAKFTRPHNLKNHISTMHAERPQKQEQSSVQQLASKQPLEQAPQKKFECGSCAKVFSKKHSLKQHELSHCDVKREFRCHYEDCAYAGLTSESLKIHLVSHAKEAHACKQENCKYVGKSEMHLKRHLKCHLQESSAAKWFACDQCDFKARIKGHLRRHRRRHTGEKPHQCPHCDFQCSNFDNLRKHIVKTGKHPGKFMYECAACLKDEAGNATLFKSNNFKEYQLHLLTHKQA